eukprot:549549-Prymnesium_polylepis.1
MNEIFHPDTLQGEATAWTDRTGTAAIAFLAMVVAVAALAAHRTAAAERAVAAQPEKAATML